VWMSVGTVDTKGNGHTKANGSWTRGQWQSARGPVARGPNGWWDPKTLVELNGWVMVRVVAAYVEEVVVTLVLLAALVAHDL
jgi:hypothetical protein